MIPAVELRGVGKRYGGTVAADDVSFAVAPGEFVVLLGPSGAGKSTVFRCVSRLVAPDTGDVLVQGERMNALAGRRDRRDLSRRRRRRRVEGGLALVDVGGLEIGARDIACGRIGAELEDANPVGAGTREIAAKPSDDAALEQPLDIVGLERERTADVLLGEVEAADPAIGGGAQHERIGIVAREIERAVEVVDRLPVLLGAAEHDRALDQELGVVGAEVDRERERAVGRRHAPGLEPGLRRLGVELGAEIDRRRRAVLGRGLELARRLLVLAELEQRDRETVPRRHPAAAVAPGERLGAALGRLRPRALHARGVLGRVLRRRRRQGGEDGGEERGRERAGQAVSERHIVHRAGSVIDHSGRPLRLQPGVPCGCSCSVSAMWPTISPAPSRPTVPRSPAPAG
ncbi:MAG: ATP-binding cassette domain-containing protein [Alphaproteobacteria bacterium]|nr:ATP-binding cassette domain-containing protein [Alphaproteobacteria bacterium]